MVISPRSSFIVKNIFLYSCLFCYSRWICKLLFLTLGWLELDFLNGNYIKSMDCLQHDSLLYYINPANPRVRETFPHLEMFGEFILRDVNFLYYRLFACLVRVTCKLFHIICVYCEGCCFPNFFLSLFFFSMWRGKLMIYLS